MVEQHNEEGWKVNILTNIEKTEETEEAISKIVWSRRKKIKVVLVLMVLLFGVCTGLIFYKSTLKKEPADKFINLVNTGAYGYARTEYIKTDEDVDKYSEFVENYYEELVDEYNETNDDLVLYSIRRFEEVFEYKFNLNTGRFSTIYESKNNYKYGLNFYEIDEYMTAYTYFSSVLKIDSNYESAQKYMNDIREAHKDEVITINVWYTNKQEKLIAQKLEEMYKEADTEKKLYKSEIKYKLVNEVDIEKGMPEGESGIIFTGNNAYYESSHTYSSSTEILAYNTDYFDRVSADSMDEILEKNMEIPSIYIPFSDGKFLAGILSTYNCSIYREEIFEDDRWIYSEGYTAVIGDHDLQCILNYVRKLKNNPNVYTAEDGIEKFVNGEIAAAIISSDEYEWVKEKLGDKVEATRLPRVCVEGIDLKDGSSRLQGVNRYRTIEFVSSDDKSFDVVYEFGDGIYTSEFARYIMDEFDLYNDAITYIYGTDDRYIDIVEQQCIENYNNIDYYDEKVGKWMDELAAFTRKATTEEDVINYIENSQYPWN